VTPHPASRILLLYAACLALMLVAAISIAALRDTPSASADTDAPPVEARAQR
jgi:hypothetical protein